MSRIRGLLSPILYVGMLAKGVCHYIHFTRDRRFYAGRTNNFNTCFLTDPDSNKTNYQIGGFDLGELRVTIP